MYLYIDGNSDKEDTELDSHLDSATGLTDRLSPVPGLTSTASSSTSNEYTDEIMADSSHTNTNKTTNS